MNFSIRIASFKLAILLLSSVALGAQSPPQRAVAITIDDLPAASADFMTGNEIDAMTRNFWQPCATKRFPPWDS